MRKHDPYIIIGFIIIFILMMCLGVVYGSSGNETMCNQIMYSDNWTLGYLRNVSAICSNGG